MSKGKVARMFGKVGRIDQSGWPNERFGAWAPGMYFIICRGCNETYLGDKRSFLCYPCAKRESDERVTNNVGAGI